MGGLFGLFGGGHYGTSVDSTYKNAMTTAGGEASDDRNRYMQLLGGGQSALNQSAASAMSAAMPSFMHAMQNVNESAVRRGISTGDLGTSFEGDTASAFDRNFASSIGQQAMNLYGTQLGATGNMMNADTNRYMSMLGGQRDYETAQNNAKRQRNASLFGGLGSAIGGYFGGPLGSSIGGAIGQGIGG